MLWQAIFVMFEMDHWLRILWEIFSWFIFGHPAPMSVVVKLDLAPHVVLPVDTFGVNELLGVMVVVVFLIPSVHAALHFVYRYF